MKGLNIQIYNCLLAFISISLVCYLHSVTCQQLICENRNPEGHTPRKTEGDGGFRIIVVGNYSNRGHYAPNDVYTVTIQGVKTRYSTQKFTEFLLVAESEKQAQMGQSGLMTTGVFHIVDDSHSRFSDMCPDGVTNMNMQPKTEISVLWTAPSTLVSSCITFKATVVERPHVWYQDDRQLTKVLCPEMPRRMRVPRPNRAQSNNQDNGENGMEAKKSRRNMVKNEGVAAQAYKISEIMAIKKNMSNGGSLRRDLLTPTVETAKLFIPDRHPQTTTEPSATTIPPPASAVRANGKCCACDEAKYEVRFEGIWSKDTHPKDFPENEWLLHFSDIIGASHSSNFSVWKPGEVASEGIRQVAEWGATRHLETELKSKSQFINTIIKAKGLWHPDERGTTSAAFRVDNEHHLMSLVSMIGPSPDWIVGIISFNLCLQNCTWLDEAEFDLYPYDAGTDSGVTYMSPNTPTEPRGKIRALTNQDPDDPRSPFFGIEPMKPFAKAHIRRQRVYPKSCDDTSKSADNTHEIYLTENSEDISRPECAVSEWTPWSDCSVKCGKGLRMRKRSYLLPMKADMFRCDRQLVEKEMCLGDEPSCAIENTSIFEEFDSICAVTPWSDWTPCSVTCGKGNRSRFRRYKNHMGRKKCNVDMTQTEMCVISMDCSANETSTDDDENCPMMPWSHWTPCSVTCGIGIRERTRFPLLADEDEIREKCGSMTTTQRATCTGEFGISCQINKEEAKEICSLPPDAGPCRNDQTKFHFSVEKSMCVPFDWSGCKGNRNRFDTEDECNEVCGFLRSIWASPTESTTTTTTTTITNKDLALPVSKIASSATSNLEISSFPFTTLSMAKTTPEASTTTTTTPTPSIQPMLPDTQTTSLDLSDVDTDDETEDTKAVETEAKPIFQTRPTLDLGKGADSLQRIDCVVTRWSSWSHCSVTCGLGVKTRLRSVLIEPQNGGKLCPRLLKRKTCRLEPC